MNDQSEVIKKKIVETLKLHPEGLTVLELSKIIDVHRQTVAKYVLVLEAAGIVYIRRAGSATINYLKEQFAKNANILKNLERLKK